MDPSCFTDKAETIIIDDDEDVGMANDPNRLLLKNAIRDPDVSYQVISPTTSKKPTTPTSWSPSSSLTSRRSPSHSQATFRNLNWGPKPASMNRSTSISNSLSKYTAGRLPSLGSSGFSRSFALSPSPTSFSFGASPGSADEPIELDNTDDLNDFRCVNPEQENGFSNIRIRASQNHRTALGSGSNPDDEEDITDPSGKMTTIKPERSARKLSMRQYSVDSEVIELEGWKDLELRGVIPEGAEVICLEDAYGHHSKPQCGRKAPKVAKFERRNPSITGPFRICENISHNNMELRPNETVELQDGGLVRIKEVIHNTHTQEDKIRGHRLQRARHLNGLLGSKVNEVVLFLEIDLDDPRDPLEQGAVEIPVKDIAKVRLAHFTNQRFPDCRAISVGQYGGNLEAATLGGLTIRWRYTCKYATATDRYNNIFKERTLERIRPEECLQIHALSNETRRFQWRGETIRGGSYQPMIDDEDIHKQPTEEELLRVDSSGAGKRKFGDNLNEGDGSVAKRVRHGENGEVEDTRKRLSEVHLDEKGVQERIILDLTESDTDADEVQHQKQPPQHTLTLRVIDLTSLDISSPPPTGSIVFTTAVPPPPIHRTANQALTYGDAFCGAGGSTRGALQAGLRPKWGFDFAPHACASWRANFPFAECYNIEAHSFVSHASRPANIGAFKVDILHLSPPCQYFSPAHTVEGVDDEQNVASLFAVEEVIKVARPRVVTLEQTFGIACSRFRWYFNSLIQMFTSQDFSVRWAVVPLAQWGLPQRRNRLIIIASCPGEILPRMPLSTHSSTDTSLLPLASASSTLSSIPPNAPDHNPHSPSLIFPPHRQMPPWDGSKILPRAMTTSGGQNYHPSGKRDLTLREYACLQGFPLEHVFRGNYVKKQIGNAVPPCVARVLFESIRRDLEGKDGIVEGVELVE